MSQPYKVHYTPGFCSPSLTEGPTSQWEAKTLFCPVFLRLPVPAPSHPAFCPLNPWTSVKERTPRRKWHPTLPHIRLCHTSLGLHFRRLQHRRRLFWWSTYRRGWPRRCSLVSSPTMAPPLYDLALGESKLSLFSRFRFLYCFLCAFVC
jgi:hypothetical protein